LPDRYSENDGSCIRPIHARDIAERARLERAHSHNRALADHVVNESFVFHEVESRVVVACERRVVGDDTEPRVPVTQSGSRQ
jgi:hypothetical protein